MSNQPTQAQTNRIAGHWSEIARERVEVHATGGPSDAVYGFASELGCHRIADKMSAGRVGFSENLGSWYFVNR